MPATSDLGSASVLDEAKIPNLKNVMAAMIKPLRDITKGTLSAVPYDLGQTGIAYNTKHISKEKAEKLGAALLWDKESERQAGKLGRRLADQHVVRGPAHRPEPQRHHGPGRRVGRPARPARHGEKILGLRRRADEPAGQRGDLCHRGLVRPRGRPAAEGHPIGYLAPNGTLLLEEYIFVLKGTDLDVAQQLLNFMLEPAAAIAVAEGQKYPPSLDPDQGGDDRKIKKMPAFDPTGKLEGYLFANPAYWNAHQVEWTEKWDRIKAGSYKRSGSFCGSDESSVSAFDVTVKRLFSTCGRSSNPIYTSVRTGRSGSRQIGGQAWQRNNRPWSSSRAY